MKIDILHINKKLAIIKHQKIIFYLSVIRIIIQGRQIIKTSVKTKTKKIKNRHFRNKEFNFRDENFHSGGMLTGVT